MLAREYSNCPNGLILPTAMAEARYVHKTPIAMDFFAGCGGMSLGFHQAGYHVIAASEWSCDAAITYMANLSRYDQVKIHFVEDADEGRLEKCLNNLYKKSSLGNPPPTAGRGWISHQPKHHRGCEHFFLGDIRKLSGEKILKAIGLSKGDLDCVMGGPPCQGFSSAGKKDIMDPRNSLVFEFARMIVELSPKTMIFENVPGIINFVTPEGIPVIEAFAQILNDGNFMAYDAFKKSIGVQMGNVGLMKGGKVKRDGKKPVIKKTTSEQTDLFADAEEE